jgi:hypothetical protein
MSNLFYLNLAENTFSNRDVNISLLFFIIKINYLENFYIYQIKINKKLSL